MQNSTANDPRIAAPRASLADAARAVLLPFFVTRGTVLAAGALAAIFIGYTPEPGHPSAWRLDADPLRNMLARWDTFFYLDIATRGYSWNGNAHQGQNVVFFPLFPMLMRAAGWITGGHPLLAGLLVSLIAFLLALLVFWRWTADRLGPETATGAVWLLSAFPLAVFFSAVYTESLYLLLVVSACYFAERRRFAATAAAGFFSGLVRPNGLLLSMPIAWMMLIADRDRRRMVWRGAAILAPFAGLLCYSAYLGWRFGDPLAWLAGQAAWGSQRGQPAALSSSIDLWWLIDALPLAFVVASIAPVTRRFGAAYGLFIGLNIAPPLLRHGVMSLGRFSSVMFPAFAWLAWRVRGRARTCLVVGCATLQAVLGALFFTWHPIF
jgi:hypothetical protein